MNAPPDTPRLNKKFYAKMSATATKQFSEEMQKRRKPFLLNETQPINARISIKKTNKENTVRPSSPCNKNDLNKALQLPGKNSINTKQHRLKMDCSVLHKYHHSSSKTLREIDSNAKTTYPDNAPGKIEIENIPIKTHCVANETVPIGNYQGKPSIDFYQAPTQSNENQNITSDVEQLLKMHKEMTELKQKLEEKYKNTLEHRHQLISYGTINNGTPGTETDHIMATIHERYENEAPKSQKITPTNMHGIAELLTTTTLFSLAKASGIEYEQRLSLITDEPCNARRETLNETMKLFTKLLKPKALNGSELQTFTEVTSKESLIAAKTGNSKRETLIRKVNLLRHVMVLTSRATGGNHTSGYQSLTEEDFNNYKIERLINSTLLTTTATNPIEASGNETLNKIVGIENIETEGGSFEPITNSSLFATVETVENEIFDKINSIAVKEETNSTCGNETARSQSLFALNEALKNAKTLAENLESLTNIVSSCTKETSGIETNSSRSLSLVTKGENKLDIESINRCLELLINEFITTTETNRIETTGHNSTFCKETNENKMACCEGLGLITKSMNNIGEQNLNTVLNFLETTLNTSGNETAKCLISQELNKEKYKGLQVTIIVKETSGIETPRYLMQLISKKSNGNETPQSPRNQHLIKSRLKRNFPYIYNKIKTISQIPNEIIKIPKKYLTYRAQNTETSFINKENGNEAMASQGGDDGKKETRVGKNARLKLKTPIKSFHGLKHFVNPKGCKNDEQQKERYVKEHFKQIERKDKAMAELLDKAVNKGFPHLREGAKNKKEECGPKQMNVERYGGTLYGLWDPVKKYPEAHVNFTTNESKNDRKSGENREQLRGENREMNLENEEDKREETILKEKREDEIKEREKKCQKNEGEHAVQQLGIIAKKELGKQELMPKGSQYSNVEKIPKKKYSFRKSLFNYFAKEEKTNATDAKNTKEDCATQKNDSDDRYEVDRMAEHFTQMFHI